MRAVILACVLVSTPLAAAAKEAPANSNIQTPAAAAGQDAKQADASPQQAEAPEPGGYTYNPEGRRDPFVSLIRRGVESPGTPTGPRPPGLAGLTASDVSLRGTMKARDGFVAMLQGADNKTYLVRPGDRLLDGTVRAIAADSLVIAQRVTDPLAGETQREVRKELHSAQEGK